MIRPPPRPTLFPYTPLFRSLPQLVERGAEDRQVVDPFVLAESLIVRITQQRVTLPVIVVQVVLMKSEEHTSELQSRLHLVCRLLLEKKKKKKRKTYSTYKTE